MQLVYSNRHLSRVRVIEIARNWCIGMSWLFGTAATASIAFRRPTPSITGNVMSQTEFKSSSEQASANTSSVLEPEIVGMAVITLHERPRSALAVLRSFSGADKILVDWSLEFGGTLDCEFEITYSDGHKVSGMYRFVRKGSAKPALTRYLRAVALAACRGEPCSLVTGLKASNFVFLDRYETNDLPMPESVRAALYQAISHSASACATLEPMPDVG